MSEQDVRDRDFGARPRQLPDPCSASIKSRAEIYSGFCEAHGLRRHESLVPLLVVDGAISKRTIMSQPVSSSRMAATCMRISVDQALGIVGVS